jgi:hypothetical protein
MLRTGEELEFELQGKLLSFNQESFRLTLYSPLGFAVFKDSPLSILDPVSETLHFAKDEGEG